MFYITKVTLILFNLLVSEVCSIIELCNQFEHDKQFYWDIPTVCEWLALADCETKPYPWGMEKPTPIHANIRFGEAPLKLRPVGSYPAGVSKYKTFDCCGNVHEIVTITLDKNSNKYPTNYRIMGRCYYTQESSSSCQIIRQLKKRKDDAVQNIGLRLIRTKQHNIGERKYALEHFLKLYQVRTMSAIDIGKN